MNINVFNIDVLNNPCHHACPLQFQISFDCIEPGCREELEWRLVFMSTIGGKTVDTELDILFVGPVPIGKNKFIFDAPAPDIHSIPRDELLDMTGLMLTGIYRGHIFIRVGYYMRFEFPFELPINEATNVAYIPSDLTIPYDQIKRNIAADKPRVTRYIIPWDKEDDDITQLTMLEANDGLSAEAVAQANAEEPAPDLDDALMDDSEEEDEASQEGDYDIDLDE